MLRPNRGEGERPKYKSKAPQITLAVLLSAYPICLAEQATYASVSSFGVLPQSSQQPPLLATQHQFRLGNLQGLNTGKTPFFNPFSLTKEEYQIEVNKATATLNSAKKALQTAQGRLDSLTTAKNKAQTALDASKTAFDTATSQLDTLKDAADSTSDSLDAAKEALDTALNNLTSAKEALQSADDLLTAQTNITQSAQTALATAQATLTTASANLQSAQNTLNAASITLSNKLSNLQSAQSAYDSSSISNPNYVAPSYTTQPTSYQIPDANFLTGNEWIGDGTSQSGLPEIHSGHIHFSYIGTEVYQDILLYPRSIADYNFTVAVYNQDQNSVNQGEIPDTYGLRIYFYDANNNLIHQNELTSNAIHSWQDVTLQGTTNTTTEVAKVRIGVYGIDNGFWAGTYGPAMNNVRLTLGWITGTTQGSTTTATMPVDIGEGGEVTYTAPEGSTFISSNLRYESYNDPTCGADVSPQLGTNTITLAADNSVWGDPCGGQVKHLVGTLTYSVAQPQFIKDPALYTALQTAQSEYDSAQSAYVTAQSSFQQAQNIRNLAQSSVETEQSYVTDYQTALSNLQSSKDSAASKVSNLQSVYNSAQSAHEAEQSKLEASQSALEKAQDDYDTAESRYETAQDNFANLETDFDSASTDVEEATNDLEEAQEALDSIPEPEEEPEPKEPEVVKLPPLEDLTKVNFAEIKATDLTSAQAEQLKEAALETFKTAESGSPEYNAALEALLVAAQQDDIVVDEALAEIPGIGAAAVAVAEVLNLLSNVGADISPEAREDAQQATVAAVIVGQVAQAAMATATMRRP